MRQINLNKIFKILFYLIKIILLPFSGIYYLIIKIRNFLFDIKFFDIEKINTKIISVGNITVGGAGKTPTVIYIVNLLKANGFNPGILSRGYKRKSSGYKYVFDGQKFLLPIEETGDEIQLAANATKAPAAVAEKRTIGAKLFVKDANIDSIVLDDAFQHRWINRNFDIVVLDQRFLNKKNSLEKFPLPSGIMRESFKSIQRADCVILNRKFSDKTNLPQNYLQLLKTKPFFEAYYEAKSFVDIKTGEEFRLNDFVGQQSLVVCGIARPYSFLHCLEKNGIDFTNKLLFPDHKNYTRKEIHNIRKQFYATNAFSVLTTEKDAVKLFAFKKELDDIDIYYLKIELKINKEREFKELILKSLTLMEV